MNTLNSRFRNIYNIDKKDIEFEYENIRKGLKKNQQKSLEKFMKSPEYVRGITNSGITQINDFFGQQSAAAKKDYENKIRKLQFDLQQRQARSQL